MKPMLLALMLVFSLSMQAQINNLMNRAKSKVQNRVNQRVDQAMDKALDDLENPQAAKPANKPTQKPAAQPAVAKAETKEATDDAASAAPAKVVGYSKFDFVPGERVIYAEDFAQDAIGELPLTWNSSGKGEVMTLNSQQGKWLRIFENNTYLSGNTKSFGDNYTIEFDLMFYFEPKVKGYILPGWSFGLFSSGGTDPADNVFLRDQAQHASTEVKFGFGSYALAQVESRVKRNSVFLSNKMDLGETQAAFNKVVHYSIQVQKTRLRLWINESKVFDIPRAMSTADTVNQIYFQLEGSNYQESEIGLFVSNIKVATGLPDTRHKLVEEGKFSTTGILFDFQSAVIKPESFGVIREVATVLKENPTLNIKIIGHTSNDGDDAANMELSKQRAAAVKELMMKEFGIEASRLASEGKGETAPVADNKTKEGKMQNRRVEFVKM
ncbi:OmpA family protein [Pseudocnuella soli]|uniref:OmpA family protein n=1 Tax=Pseudocnuella soli TaxID=2502779 RepID=UPI00104EB3D7|nr:OmpA family protein [Pseudocnuella soli]